MTKLILCADDFGLNRQVDDAIISLVENNRLNAVSCMSVGSRLQEDASRLLKVQENANFPVQIGLHLTFTEYSPLSAMPMFTSTGTFPSIGSLILRTYLGQINEAEIIGEIERQFSTFHDIFGQVPDFVDGHQHAHVLPTIREALIRQARSSLKPDGWIRSCHRPVGDILKTGTSVRRTLLISLLSRQLKKLLSRNDFPTYEFFYGVNDFNRSQCVAQLMQIWLKSAGQKTGTSIIMCHPGVEPQEADLNIYDPIASRRPDEHAYLLSGQFVDDLKKSTLELG